jgi:hypothetical protein
MNICPDDSNLSRGGINGLICYENQCWAVKEVFTLVNLVMLRGLELIKRITAKADELLARMD